MIKRVLIWWVWWCENVQDECVYTVYTRTGSIILAGTESTISLALFDQFGMGLNISDLRSWGGLMGPYHSYFERGNLDSFSGRGPCLSGPICSMRLSTDGTGPHHGWYCNYVEVTSTGAHIPCSQRQFTVEQWLALDAPPYELTTVRDNCPSAQLQRDSPRSISMLWLICVFFFRSINLFKTAFFERSISVGLELVISKCYHNVVGIAIALFSKCMTWLDLFYLSMNIFVN